MKLQLASIFGLLALAEGNVLHRRAACNADYCLRGIRAAEVPGAADCANYWASTVTPAAITITVTETITSSFTKTSPQTLTNTLLATLTDIEDVTFTATTIQVTATVTRDFAPEDEDLPGGLGRRQIGSSITFSDASTTAFVPAYASPCSSMARYSSACACLTAGTPGVVTAPTPTSTITEVTTVDTTATISPTVATVDITVTDFTISTTQTVATVTQTSTIATVEWVGIYLVGRDDDATKAHNFLKRGPALGGDSALSQFVWTTDKLQAQKFYLNLSNGNLKYQPTVAAPDELVYSQFVAKDALYVYGMSPAKAITYGVVPLVFEYDIDNNFKVNIAGYTKMGYTNDGFDRWIIAKTNVNWGRFKATQVQFEIVSS